jgi:hypothetical protein
MPALVAGIHVFLTEIPQARVDGRDKPGRDPEEWFQLALAHGRTYSGPIWASATIIAHLRLSLSAIQTNTSALEIIAFVLFLFHSSGNVEEPYRATSYPSFAACRQSAEAFPLWSVWDYVKQQGK